MTALSPADQQLVAAARTTHRAYNDSMLLCAYDDEVWPCYAHRLLGVVDRQATRVAALEETLDFRASVEFVGGFRGSDLLRGVAFWMDTIDDERGTAKREVQADLRRWADSVDRALVDAADDAAEARFLERPSGGGLG